MVIPLKYEENSRIIRYFRASTRSCWNFWSQDFEAPQREALSAAVRENLQKFPVEMQATLVLMAAMGAESLDV